MALLKTQLLAFDRFRAAYPRRPDNPWSRAKPRFEEALRRGVDSEALIRAAGSYAQQCAALGKDAKFIVYASTFLHQRDYEDFLEEAPAPAGDPAPPIPEHPLHWLAAEIGASAWMSWISRLQVDPSAAPIGIIAPTQFVLERVRRHYGAQILAAYGEVAWDVQQGDPS